MLKESIAGIIKARTNNTDFRVRPHSSVNKKKKLKTVKNDEVVKNVLRD